MRIGVFQSGWWSGASAALGIDCVELPIATHPSGNSYQADLSGRTSTASDALSRISMNPADLLLDNGGAGLLFVRMEGQAQNYQLFHEQLKLPLASHFIDPLTTSFQGLGWPVVWQSLKSPLWIKAVWDRAQAIELRRFGIPSVVHLPMAAPDRPYDTTPIDPAQLKPVVSFVGSQNSSYFAQGVSVYTRKQLPGVLASAVHADLPEVRFLDVYYDLYGLEPPIQKCDDLQTEIRKAFEYFEAKLFFHAQLCIRNRDRFVLLLKHKLGDAFRLIGQRWDTRYGIRCEPPLPTNGDFFNHFRKTLINLNLVNGNAETGLNMRHFEITAAGGFMLCYRQPELEDCFVIGRECDVFDNEKELLEKIRYYLAHPQRCVEIALAGQQRTLRDHLYSNRLRSLLQLARQQSSTSSPNEPLVGAGT